VDEQIRFLNSRFLETYPVYEQGVVYEWNFNTTTDLHVQPKVSGYLNSVQVSVPLVESELDFWNSPPTRLETTTSEISGYQMLSPTLIATSGSAVMLQDTTPPLYNRIYLEFSGIAQFRTTVNDADQPFGRVIIRGRWPNDSARNPFTRYEEIPVVANGITISQHAWSYIKSIETRGVDPNGYMGASVLNVRPQWRPSPLEEYYPVTRNRLRQTIFWHNVAGDTKFGSMVQPELMETAGPSDETFLAKSRLLTDTIQDDDVEFDMLDVWKIQTPGGGVLSGIVDFVPVPATRYMLLLDGASRAWVTDTWKPAVNMTGFAETTESPLRILATKPRSSDETPSSFTIELNTDVIRTDITIDRWRWVMHYSGEQFIMEEDQSRYPFYHLSGWQYGNDKTVSPPQMLVPISGTGQFVFELETADRDGSQYKTYYGTNVVEKQALASLPIRGLDADPDGIDFDWYGRPWVTIGNEAIRLVMRTDVGQWIPEERVLITREPYDEVRRR
jgi:hypothetical protein